MMDFKDVNGKSVSYRDIINLVKENYNYEVFVGSDSQVHRKIKKVVYVTCIVLYQKGKGGRVFVARERERYADSLRQRLMNETYRSLQVAFDLNDLLPDNVELVIHIDVNKKRKYKSSKYRQELVGMVTGQGFECRVKPYAWAAQGVADKFSK
jgi:predicted RNase H-related nuclease YkuK (DUF458 family)